jgi:apolipoprotein N-acyltransferase
VRVGIESSLFKDIRRTVKTAALAVALILGAYATSVGGASAESSWLVWFSLVPLFLVIRRWRPRAAAIAGLLWGASLYALSFAHPESTVCPGIATFLLLVTVPAAYMYLGAWLTRRVGFNPFVLGVAWMGVELALGPAGLRIGLLAGAAGEGTLLGWVGKAFGYVLIAFLIAVLNASLVSVLSGARLTLPRERLFAGLLMSVESVSSRTLCYVERWAVRQAYPRGPPLPHTIPNL